MGIECIRGKVISSASDIKKSNLMGYKAFINGEVYTGDNGFTKKDLYFHNGRILPKDVFEKEAVNSDRVEIYDLGNKIVTPGLIDQHIHGGYGIDFNTANEDEIRMFLRETKKLGQSAILATFLPDSTEKLNSQMDIIRSVMKNPKNDETGSIHVHTKNAIFYFVFDYSFIK